MLPRDENQAVLTIHRNKNIFYSTKQTLEFIIYHIEMSQKNRGYFSIVIFNEYFFHINNSFRYSSQAVSASSLARTAVQIAPRALRCAEAGCVAPPRMRCGSQGAYIIPYCCKTTFRVSLKIIICPYEKVFRLRAKRYVPTAHDIVCVANSDIICCANSDMFACGERGGKYANINPRDLAHAVRSRAEGTYRAAGISHANEM